MDLLSWSYRPDTVACGRTAASWMLGKEHELGSHATNLLLIHSSQAASGM